MKREEKCILTNMCMIYDNNRILVQDRKKSTWPGVAFPGGHIEDKESFVDSVIREVKEETGLDIFDVRLCGVKQFTPKDSLCRYIVFFFKTNNYMGEVKSSSEGEVFWVDRHALSNYILAKGFDSMLEVFENDDLSENFYWLEDGDWKAINK